MKKIILGLLATAVIAAPAVAAPFDRGSNSGRYEQSRSYDHAGSFRGNHQQDHRWSRGQRFDQRYAQNDRVISNPRADRVYNAPRGYRWVQSGNDAVLVAITSGIIGAVLANILN